MTSQIIVLGAGAAGLMAGKMLAFAGEKVLIVDARNRIGGRINTVSAGSFSRAVEAGAEFIHGKLPLTFSLVKEAGGKVIEVRGRLYEIEKGVLKKAKLDRQWVTVTRALEDLQADIPLSQFMSDRFPKEKYPSLHQMVTRFVQGYDGADPQRVSAMAIREEWKSDHDDEYRVDPGYCCITNHLSEQLLSRHAELVLGTEVKSVSWKRGHVRLSTSTGQTLSGDKLVITVPLPVLQKGLIEFNPALPSHIAASKDIGYGGVIKFLIEFNQSFWDDRIMRDFKNMRFIFSDAKIPTWWSQRPLRTPLLTGWLGGPAAMEVQHDAEGLYHDALISLAYILKTDIATLRREVTSHHVTDWVSDPYSQGAYAYSTVRSRDARAVLVKPVENTLFFAGEALYDGPEMGTVEAALVTGRDVALKIIGSGR
jgi:monoamine oxidase